MSDPNLDLVRRVYAAFGRGDLAAILDACAVDVDWRLVGRAGDYPTFGAWKGREGVAEFFRLVNALEEFQEFAPKELHASGDKVFALGSYALIVKQTGRAVASDWVHVFTLRDGRVAAFREFMDTAQAVAAWRG